MALISRRQRAAGAGRTPRGRSARVAVIRGVENLGAGVVLFGSVAVVDSGRVIRPIPLRSWGVVVPVHKRAAAPRRRRLYCVEGGGELGVRGEHRRCARPATSLTCPPGRRRRTAAVQHLRHSLALVLRRCSHRRRARTRTRPRRPAVPLNDRLATLLARIASDLREGTPPASPQSSEAFSAAPRHSLPALEIELGG
jgi:hypothetical protein